MKVFKNDSVYVQNNDLAYLNSTDLGIPASIYMKYIGNGKTITNDNNRYDFIKFDEDSEIEFFKGLDWIIDYNEVKDLSEDEIIKISESIGKEHEEIATSFNSMSRKEQQQHNDLITKCDFLEFKFYSIIDFLWFKQGHISMELPVEENVKIKKDNK